ncbi:MAG: hypothetical protein IT371_19130 [Deltaproteobacteria bacterium]|nr:hypothetical protein [Deltaproteobacteria bacterium]
MLEHVAPHQTRYVVPGLVSDARGVALGRFCAVLLPSVDRVVGLLRGLSEAISLDEILATLRVVQLRTPLASREFLVLVPVTNSHSADGVAAVGRLVGGLVFTGTNKHFVRFRDPRAPLGYDVDSLHAGGGDFVLYAAEFVQAYAQERDLSVAQLVLGLSVLPDRGEELGANERLIVRVVRGLWPAVLGYLHRNNVPCQAAACEGSGPEAAEGPFYLLRVEGLPARMFGILRSLPGVELYRQRAERAAVELGYRHPVELSSCASIFGEGRYYLFSGRRDRLEVVEGEPVYVAARSLVRLGPVAERPPTRELRPLPADGVSVPLRLVVAAGATPRVSASRIPSGQEGWLKKLVYLLPPPVLASYTVCRTESAVYLLREGGVDFVPLGEQHYAAAPGIFVPLGYQLLPKVHPEVLVQHLGGSAEVVHFFEREGATVVRLPRAAFQPLARAILAPVTLAAPERPTPTAEEARPTPVIANEPVGWFPLWGFTGGSGE